MGPLAAQGAGPGVHGAAPGVGAALEPRGAQDAGREQAAREVKLHQLGLEAHAASLDTLDLHVQSGQLLVNDLLDTQLQLLTGGGRDKDRGIGGPVPGVGGEQLLLPPLRRLVALGPVQGRASVVGDSALALLANNS